MSKTTQDELRANGKTAFYTFGSVGADLMLFGILFGSAFFLQWAVYFLIAAVAVHKTLTAGADAIDWTSQTASVAVGKLKFWDKKEGQD